MTDREFSRRLRELVENAKIKILDDAIEVIEYGEKVIKEENGNLGEYEQGLIRGMELSIGTIKEIKKALGGKQ